MQPARILFVDDDASIRKFVALALDEMAVELVLCASVAEARAALRAGAFRLVLTDLMMPVETGLDLLQEIAADPTLARGAHVAVFSAGLNAAMKARLESLAVWRQLSKPISVMELLSCVEDATAETMPAATPAAPGATPTDDDDPVRRHFGGDHQLYRSFRAACVAQFVADRRAGDAAVAGHDASALRHLAHSLKSVLATLGHPAASTLARELESAAEAADWPLCEPLWRRLAAALPDE